MQALAADLARPAPPPPVVKAPPLPPVFNWTGFYLGGNLGGAWGGGGVTDTLFGASFDSANSNGVFGGGGQVGANYQISNVVLGVEGDFDWAANSNNTTNGVAIGGNTFTATANDRWLTTLTGRLGLAFDRVLIYGKGGGAWVGNSGFTVTNVTAGASVTGSSSNSASGWTAGGGVEWAFAGNWTVRAEYDYDGLSNRSFTIPLTSPVLAGDTITVNHHISMATIGINYLFNAGGPVVASY